MTNLSLPLIHNLNDCLIINLELLKIKVRYSSHLNTNLPMVVLIFHLHKKTLQLLGRGLLNVLLTPDEKQMASEVCIAFIQGKMMEDPTIQKWCTQEMRSPTSFRWMLQKSEPTMPSITAGYVAYTKF